MGFGTWAWGNKVLWDYREERDEDLYHAFREAVSAGVVLWDTGDSYGLDGRAETLLGRFATRLRDEGVLARGPADLRLATKARASAFSIRPRRPPPPPRPPTSTIAPRSSPATPGASPPAVTWPPAGPASTALPAPLEPTSWRWIG